MISHPPTSDLPPGRALIVIPTLNESKHISALLDRVIAEATLLDAQIVVVDGGSIDGTLEIALDYQRRFSPVSVLHNDLRIQSAAINLAVEKFGDDAEYVIRVDAHGDYPADYCSALIREAQTMSADSVVVPMTTVGFGMFQRAVATAQNSIVGTGGSSHRTGKGGQWVEHGHHALMRISAYRAVGGYDNNFRHNEDAELDYRLGRAGYRIWLTSATFMTYYPRSTPSALFRQYLGYGRGRARNIFKHHAMPRLRQLLPLAIIPAVALAALSIFQWYAVLPLAGWIFACLTLGIVATSRQQRQYGLPPSQAPLVGVAAMIMHFAWSTGFWLHVVEALGRRPRAQ